MTHLTRRLFVAAAATAAIPLSARATDLGPRYRCDDDQCAPYIYDPAVGDPIGRIPSGTPFADLPDDWVCPVCGAPKSEFVRMAD